LFGYFKKVVFETATNKQKQGGRNGDDVFFFKKGYHGISFLN
jgi:hypothetical protein